MEGKSSTSWCLAVGVMEFCSRFGHGQKSKRLVKYGMNVDILSFSQVTESSGHAVCIAFAAPQPRERGTYIGMPKFAAALSLARPPDSRSAVRPFVLVFLPGLFFAAASASIANAFCPRVVGSCTAAAKASVLAAAATTG